ncbi:hypothetical protein Tco_1541881 [Tanacetum coccineum]
MKSNIQDQANDLTLWDVLKCKFKKSSTLPHSCRDDAFHSRHHDDHNDDDAPPEGEKRAKRHKTSKIIDEDEVIPEDETPKQIAKFHNIDKRIPTIFYYAIMEATLNDTMNNQFINAEEYAYHLEQSTNFIKNQIVWESRQEDIRRSKPKALVFYGPQRNPNEPPRIINEMIKEEMLRLIHLAVKKGQEITPTYVPELISKEFATNAPKMIEELFQKHMWHTTLNLYPTTSTSTAKISIIDLQHQLYLKMKSKLQDQAAYSKL